MKKRQEFLKVLAMLADAAVNLSDARLEKLHILVNYIECETLPELRELVRFLPLDYEAKTHTRSALLSHRQFGSNVHIMLWHDFVVGERPSSPQEIDLSALYEE